MDVGVELAMGGGGVGLRAVVACDDHGDDELLVHGPLALTLGGRGAGVCRTTVQRHRVTTMPTLLYYYSTAMKEIRRHDY